MIVYNEYNTINEVTQDKIKRNMKMNYMEDNGTRQTWNKRVNFEKK